LKESHEGRIESSVYGLAGGPVGRESHEGRIESLEPVRTPASEEVNLMKGELKDYI